jgi:hypothetical protein
MSRKVATLVATRVNRVHSKGQPDTHSFCLQRIRRRVQSIQIIVFFVHFSKRMVFVALLCAFKFGIFLFFTDWITIMTVFFVVFLPETKGVPIEEMVLLWRKHWFWKKVMPEAVFENSAELRKPDVTDPVSF